MLPQNTTNQDVVMLKARRLAQCLLYHGIVPDVVQFVLHVHNLVPSKFKIEYVFYITIFMQFLIVIKVHLCLCV